MNNQHPIRQDNNVYIKSKIHKHVKKLEIMTNNWSIEINLDLLDIKISKNILQNSSYN